MAIFKLDNKLKSSDIIEFDLYTNLDSTLTDTKIIKQNLEASEKLILTVINRIGWQGHRYSDDGVIKSGYGTQVNLDSIGSTENESYGYFIDKFKKIERQFKKDLPLDTLSQTVYDALLSLYFFTGSISQVGNTQRRFNLAPYIKEEKWAEVASIFVLAGNDRIQRQREAKIMMLADYGKPKSRALIKSEGIENLRALHFSDRFVDNKAKQQAEYVYYYETRRFLPNLSQSRKSEIVKLYKATGLPF